MTASLPTLSHLERIAREATPGPWLGRIVEAPLGDTGDADLPYVITAQNGKEVVCIPERYVHHDSFSDYEADGAFIAAFNPAVALTLIAHIRALEEGVKGLSAKLLTARTLMEGSGWWRNDAGHMTDAALWIERADDEARALLLKETENG